MPQGRTAAKLIRFAPDELAAVSSRARACGRTPARFIREAALGAIPKARHNEDRDRTLLALALEAQLQIREREGDAENPLVFCPQRDERHDRQSQRRAG